MLPWIILLACVVILVIGTITDIKSLEVPDWLTHGGIALGLVIGAGFSVIDWSIIPLASSLAGLALASIIACLMFYTGQWGGGDAKLLMALGALVGFQPNIFSFGTSYIVNLIFIGGIWGLIWSIGLALREKNKTWKTFKELRQEPKYRSLRAASIIAIVILLIVSFIWSEAQVELVVLAILVYLLASLTIFTKSVELAAMQRWISPKALTEGDWLVQTVKAGGAVVHPMKTGLQKKQVELLQKLYKQKKINKVLVKYGVPFVPAFLFAFLITLWAGNVFLLFL